MGGVWKPELTKAPEPVKAYWRQEKRRQREKKAEQEKQKNGSDRKHANS